MLSEGGIISIAALILLFAVTLKNIVWRMRLAAVRDERESLIFCLLGVTSIIVLGFREFNFTYMYATNVYGLIGAMLMMPPRKS